MLDYKPPDTTWYFIAFGTANQYWIPGHVVIRDAVKIRRDRWPILVDTDHLLIVTDPRGNTMVYIHESLIDV